MPSVLAVFAGYALGQEHVAAGPGLQPFVQDALDEIEYATGGIDTPWGAQRAADGHPLPFAVSSIEVGNEDFADRSGSYDGRFTQFYDAIKAKYPKMPIIATVNNVKSRTPDIVDDHFYRAARDFEADWRHYDNYDRTKPKIFVGEYASQEGRPTPNLKAALGDAAFMAGMERNADVVVMASYAPLLVNVNPRASQWGTNLIGFDALNSYVSPAYYTQKLFSLNHGDLTIPAAMIGSNGLSYCASKASKTGIVYIKVVNPGATEATVKIILNGFKSIASKASQTVLTSKEAADTNTIDEPNKVIPVTSQVTGIGAQFTRAFAPHSLTIITVSAH